MNDIKNENSSGEKASSNSQITKEALEEQFEQINQERQKKINEYIKIARYYTRVSAPDSEKFARLVDEAKGQYRTMSKFAEEIGVAASSLSRIVNQQVQGVSIRMIAKIAVYADEGSGVTFQKLMEAQGMRLKTGNIAEERSNNSLYSNDYLTAIQQKNIILEEFYKRNYQIRGVRDELFERMRYPLLRPVLIVETDALKEQESSKWVFLYERPRHYISTRGDNKPFLVSGFFANVERIFSILYRNECKGNKAYGRISLVVTNPDVFKLIREDGQLDFVLKDEISAILIDPQKQCIVDEYVFPNIDGEKSKKDIFYEIDEDDDVEFFDNTEFYDSNAEIFENIEDILRKNRN